MWKCRLFSVFLGGLFLIILAGLGRGTPPATQTIAGQVVDGAGPVRAAVVRCQGRCSHTRTDEQGRFLLPGPDERVQRITAWKSGYSIAAVPVRAGPLRLRLQPLPTEDNEKYHWLEPAPNPQQGSNCGNCHAEIYQEWQASVHARAASGRRFRNVYEGTDWQGRPSPQWSLLHEHPLGAGVCALCHAPTLQDTAQELDVRRAEGVSAHGVHCDYCHKITGVSLTRPGLTFGTDGYSLLRPRDGQLLFFGPLDDAYRAGEQFGHLPLYSESRYCAACHEGTLFGVPVYSTYSEWLQSPARRQGIQCQDCHMKPTGKLTNLAPGKGGVRRNPQTLASHSFPGATAEMLQTCLRVQVRLQAQPQAVQVQVEVAAQDVGHFVPTGFIDRHLVLVVQAADAMGQPVPLQQGPRLSALAGRALDGQAGYLYAKQLHGTEGQVPSPFWLPHARLIDTRLQPGHPDQHRFVFPAQTRQVRVRLLYRRFWPEVASSKHWPDNERVLLDRSWRRADLGQFRETASP